MDIGKLITGMKPKLNKGEFVFCFLPENSPHYSQKSKNQLEKIVQREDILCEFKEAEGITFVLKKEVADKMGIKYEYVAAWLTLEIHSALEAVGLTAAVSKSLAEADISANVIAAYHHDHIFVNINDGEKAR